MSPSGSPKFQVSVSQVEMARLRRWAEQAKRFDVHSELLSALASIQEKLRWNAREWGDPIRRLPGLNATIYRGLQPLIIVQYAVPDDQDIVFVQRFFVRPGSALDGLD